MTRPFFSKRERAAVFRSLRIGFSFVLAGAAVLGLLALVSYHPDDPGYYVATRAKPENWLGGPGAVIADILRKTFGIAAFYLPVLIGVWAIRLLRGRYPRAALRRLLVAPLALIGLAAFASSHAVEASSGGGLGGIVGDYVFSVLSRSAPLDSARARLVTGAVLSLALAVAATVWSLGAGRRDVARFVRTARRRSLVVGIWAAAALGVRAARASEQFQAGAETRARWIDRLTRAVWPERPAPAYAGGAPDYEGDRAEPRWVGRLSDSFAPRAARPARAEDGLSVPRAPRDGDDRWSASRRAPVEPGFVEPEIRAPEVREPFAPERREPPTPRADAVAPEADRLEPIDAPIDDLWDDRPTVSAPLESEDSSDAPLVLQDLVGASDAAGAAPAAAAKLRFVPAVAETVEAPWREAEPSAEHDSEPDTGTLDRAAPASAPRRAGAQDPAERRPAPPADLLAPATPAGLGISEKTLAERADQLQAVLVDFGVRGDIIDAHPGPVVTQFELEPAPGLKASRVVGLADDIARSMSAVAARIARIPGRNTIGIELPNETREIVSLHGLLTDPSYVDTGHALPLALGRDIAGAPSVVDLARMPHLLIGGATGSGKSVAINTMLLSLLYARTPDEVRLILIDPKMLELSVYNDVPHLLAPVVTEPKKAIAALRWVVGEMEERYQKMARLNVRSLDSYNQRIAEAAARGETVARRVQTGFDEDTGAPIYETEDESFEPMPYIVVVIDEMADLMMVAGKEIEHCVQRLAQMARASGIHLVMATQRPSVDVITGVIKANFPIRISFQVTSKFDSRTILGEGGAEQLLGKGDMLFTAGGGRLQRLHGPFVSDEEVEAVVAHLRRSGGAPRRIEFADPDAAAGGAGGYDGPALGEDSSDDALYAKAVEIVTRERRASTSFVQRRLQIGYNRAARMIEMMEAAGVVSAANRVGKREVLTGEPN